MTFASYTQHFAETTANENTQSTTNEISNDEGDEFNFIKSNSYNGNFLYSDGWLLYGGIVLIIVSITGILMILKPKKRNAQNRKKHKTYTM